MVIDGKKRCPRCDEDKLVAEFYENRRSSDGCSSYCKACTKANAMSWQAKNPERVRKNARKSGHLRNSRTWLSVYEEAHGEYFNPQKHEVGHDA